MIVLRFFCICKNLPKYYQYWLIELTLVKIKCARVTLFVAFYLLVPKFYYEYTVLSSQESDNSCFAGVKSVFYQSSFINSIRVEISYYYNFS